CLIMNTRILSLLALVVLVAGTNSAFSSENNLEPIKAEITKRHDEAVKRLQDWIAQVSIATEDRGYSEGAEYMAKLARDAGFQQATVITTDGKPGVCATLDAGAPKTVGLYFMYDVKQFDPSEWSSPPTEARIVDKPPSRKSDDRSRRSESEVTGSGVPRGPACDSWCRQKDAGESANGRRRRRGDRFAPYSTTR